MKQIPPTDSWHQVDSDRCNFHHLVPALTLVSLLERYLVLETAMPRGDIRTRPSAYLQSINKPRCVFALHLEIFPGPLFVTILNLISLFSCAFHLRWNEQHANSGALFRYSVSHHSVVFERCKYDMQRFCSQFNFSFEIVTDMLAVTSK